MCWQVWVCAEQWSRHKCNNCNNCNNCSGGNNGVATIATRGGHPRSLPTTLTIHHAARCITPESTDRSFICDCDDAHCSKQMLLENIIWEISALHCWRRIDFSQRRNPCAPVARHLNGQNKVPHMSQLPPFLSTHAITIITFLNWLKYRQHCRLSICGHFGWVSCAGWALQAF